MSRLGLLVLALVASCVATRLPVSPLVINKKIIAHINNDETSSWVAGSNDFFASLSISQAEQLMGFKPNPMGKFLPVVDDIAMKLPTSFNSTAQWPQCATIGTIYNQAKCGSCWAFGCVEAVSDRWCIHKGKQFNNILSFMEMTSCAPCYGCEGGDADSAWDYASEVGLVSNECYPYDIPTCAPEQQPCLNFSATPECINNTCNSSSQSWDPIKLSSVYDVASNQDAIMTEIQKNGPVEACFTVYADFVHYKSGVYQYKTGQELGGHCIKIIGWGVENGLPYWLCNNSWTTYWGDNGQFKILRGQDECGIEDDVVAGLP